ncbi:MAG TPA: hypothetical protein VGL72_07805 [Bryobacteraceae bacterium]
MADFRKWLLAFAAVAALLVFGSSSANAATFTCQTNAGNPTVIRGEGVAELVGDLTLNCTGGTPTPTGKLVPPSNVLVTLNTNITSRLINSSNVSEALILIDDPYPTPASENPPVANGGFVNSNLAANSQLGCLANNSVNCALISRGAGVGRFSSYNGLENTDTGPGYNVFQGVQTGANAISWQGVPIDAPGTAGTRTVRITNVRANASLLGVASTFVPTQVTELIGINGSQNILINNPSQTVAEILPGLIAANGSSSYTQCNSLNVILLGSSGPSAVPIGTTVTSVSATEGFAASFKVRNYNMILSAQAVSGFGTGDSFDSDSDVGLQNIPGFPYNTESGFLPGAIAGTGGAYVSGGGTVGTVGLATQSTEISFTFAAVQTGVSLFVPGTVTLTGNYGGALPGEAILVGGDGTGAPNQLTITGTAVTATYRISYEDPHVLETLTVPVFAAFTSNTSQNLPAAGTATVAVNFAPLSTVPTASVSAPIPRFTQTHTPANLLSIVSCTCNLLFPFVTNQFGFDTGVAIANTSADTLNGVTPQQGVVTLSYYGTTTGGGAAPPTAVTTSAVPAGGELVFTLSGGGNFGIASTPGFEGYIIAQANFQFCHGFAFISDAGAQKLAEGYLAIQLDMPGLYRTGIAGENLGH